MVKRGKLYLRRPMKVLKVDLLDEVYFPTFIVPKYDGIRVISMSGVWVDEYRKPLPKTLLKHLPDGYDGIDGIIRTKDNNTLVVYDYITPITCAFNLRERLQFAHQDLTGCFVAPAFFVKDIDSLKTSTELNDLPLTCYFRSPSSRYIQGKYATLENQGWLEYTFPFYRYASIIEVVIKKVKANRNGKLESVDDMAGIIVEDELTGHQFPITSGFGLQKGLLWRNRNYLVGKQIRYSCSTPANPQNAPMNPKFEKLCDELINQLDGEKL